MLILVSNIFYNHLLCLPGLININTYYKLLNCKYYQLLRIIVNNKHVFSYIKYNILILYSMIFLWIIGILYPFVVVAPAAYYNNIKNNCSRIVVSVAVTLYSAIPIPVFNYLYSN